jgi:hypothetical protein
MAVMEYFSRFGRSIAELLNITDFFKDPESYTPFGMSIFLLIFFVLFGWICFRKVRGTRKALREFAARRGFSFSANGRHILSAEYFRFPLFKRGRARGVRNVFTGQYDGADFTFFDYWYKSSDMSHNYLVAVFPTDNRIPDFELRHESIPDKIREKLGQKEIDFEADPEFSEKYHLSGTRAEAVQGLFRKDLRSVLTYMDRSKLDGMEGGGHWLVLYRWNADYMSRRSEKYVADMSRFLDNAFNVFEAFQRQDLAVHN